MKDNNSDTAHRLASHLQIKSGYLRKPSPTLAVNQQMQAMLREGKKVFRLGFGGSPLPVFSELAESFKKHVPLSSYPAIQGETETREAVCDFYRTVYGIPCHPDRCLIYPGSKEAIFHLLSVLEGPLLVPMASWVSYGPQADILGKEVIWLPVRAEDGWKLSPEVLQSCAAGLGGAARQKILILNSPSNPTGLVYSREELNELANVCRRQRILVIFDGIYGFARDFQDAPYTTMMHVYPEGTFFTGGLSKIFSAGGWRFGFAALPECEETALLLKALIFRLSETCSGVCLPLQKAAVTAYLPSEARDLYLRKVRSVFKAATLSVFHRLERAGLRCPRPGGGFYVFPDFSHLRLQLEKKGYLDSEAFGRHLLNSGVCVLPGECFGVGGQQFAFRFACVDFNGEKALKSAHEELTNTMEDCLAFAKRYMPELMQACDVVDEIVAGLQK